MPPYRLNDPVAAAANSKDEETDGPGIGGAEPEERGVVVRRQPHKGHRQPRHRHRRSHPREERALP